MRDRLKVGDKVIVRDKTLNVGNCCPKELSYSWEMFKKQGYLYVSRIEKDKVVLWHNNNTNEGGDYYSFRDIIGYSGSIINKHINIKEEFY